MTNHSESEPITISDVREIAKKRLPRQVWDYYTTGADDEQTVRRNEAAFQELLIRPRALRNVSNISTATTIFGKHYEIPIAVAPSAYQKLAGGNGELDVARATSVLGTNVILSSNATTTLEDVAQALASRAPEEPAPWFQLYFLKSRDLTAALIQRAERAGYEALGAIAAASRSGHGERTREAGRGHIQGGPLAQSQDGAEHRQLVEEHADSLVDSSLDWAEVIPWLRSQTKMEIILKGILTAEDAERSLEAGVDGIIVSNHGGRQLDGVSSTLEALPEIVDVVRGKIPVILDGGISRGSDVFKALALGADLCLIGRTALWGLAWDGQNGVEGVLHILERELARTMALAGTPSLVDISRSMLGRAKRDGFGIAKL
ncbi:hypothetical protein G7054_g3612 [Neopestalotiopsis clavispora]|nr:hypothetical protein G7054_g3612 [Neopestalotiopsis clavispora]